MNDDPGNNELKFFTDLLKEHTSYDLSGYSATSLKNRLYRVLRINKLNLEQLANKITKDKDFAENIIKDITVNTTELFRDLELWISLANNILPLYKKKKKLRIWHAGCSTGQEVFSMMILLKELNILDKSEVFASDINPEALETARKGVYKYSSNKIYLDKFEKLINSELIKENNRLISYQEYFTIDKISDEIKMSAELLNKPVFKLSDLINDGNIFGLHYDIIVCRNVIIYFNSFLQNKMYQLFYDNIFQKGCLILGMHEQIQEAFLDYFKKDHFVYFKKT